MHKFISSGMIFSESFTRELENGNRIAVVNILKIEWTRAISIVLIALLKRLRRNTESSTQKIDKHTTVPIILNRICTAVTRFALLLTPIDESRAVAQVPIFCPIIIGIAAR